MDLVIRTITYGSDDYRKSLDLRNKVLRLPIGLNLFDENLDSDSREMHVGAYDGKELIGILILAPKDKSTVQMRQVAVLEAYRNKGIGSSMVSYSEQLAHENDFSRIFLHARETAVTFYKKLGYSIKGSTFIEVGIPHLEMEKIL